MSAFGWFEEISQLPCLEYAEHLHDKAIANSNEFISNYNMKF